MPETSFRGRRAFQLENDQLRLTVVREGGHLAEVFVKKAGVNPLWQPHWHSIEPSTYTPETHPELGSVSEAKLLSGIMGHNLCLDLFGGPSPEEEALGYTAHGEASIVPYAIDETDAGMEQRAHLPLAQLHVARSLELHGNHIRIVESVDNLASFDRPVGWTEHVTLGSPFLDEQTEFRASVTDSFSFPGKFGEHDYLAANSRFEWPFAQGGAVDLRHLQAAPSSGYTAHLADKIKDDAFFVAFSARYRLAFGYVWKRKDFPWLGIWEENCSRQHAPWNGAEVTRGMEFGVSLFPESRQRMVERGRVSGTPAFGWLHARERREVEYWVVVTTETDTVPEHVSWPAAGD